MQLTITTDYAIRTVVLLAEKQTLVNAQEISTTMGIPINYLYTMIKRLREVGIIEADRGNRGGYRLKKDPSAITLLDIIVAMEGTTKINRCLEADHFCSRNASETCPVRCNYVNLQKMLDEAFQYITIDRILKNDPVRFYTDCDEKENIT